MTPVTYMLWNWLLVTYGLAGIAVVGWFLGPRIIARGMLRWEVVQHLFRRTTMVQLPKGMPMTSDVQAVLGALDSDDQRVN